MTTTRTGTAELGDTVWELPPLILHPFADRNSSERLLENSRQALLACGLSGAAGAEQDDLDRRLLEGRYSEIDRKGHVTGVQTCARPIYFGVPALEKAPVLRN